MQVARDRGFTRWRHRVKKWNRLKRDFNEHYCYLACPCYTDKKLQNMMADTPARGHNGKDKRDDNSQASLTPQERRVLGETAKNFHPIHFYHDDAPVV